MSLFIELYLDEDTSVLLSDLLKSRGFKTMTTRDARMLGRSDGEQLSYAVSRKSAFFTHNRIDFEKLHNEYLSAGKEHCGIIIGGRRNEYAVLKRLLGILNRTTSDEMKNQLKYI